MLAFFCFETTYKQKTNVFINSIHFLKNLKKISFIKYFPFFQKMKLLKN